MRYDNTAMNTFSFKIVTPERVVTEREVTQVSLPTSLGQITVLPHHIPLVSTIVAGEIILRDDKNAEDILAVSGGFAQVHPKKLIILADTAEMAHELDESQIEEAHKRAQDLLASKGGVRDAEYAALQVRMEREFARLKVARKYKARKSHATAP